MQKSQLGIELCDDFPGTSHMNRGHLHDSHGSIKTFVRRIFDQASDQAVTKLGVRGKNEKILKIRENALIFIGFHWFSLIFSYFEHFLHFYPGPGASSRPGQTPDPKSVLQKS